MSVSRRCPLVGVVQSQSRVSLQPLPDKLLNNLGPRCIEIEFARPAHLIDPVVELFQEFVGDADAWLRHLGGTIARCHLKRCPTATTAPWHRAVDLISIRRTVALWHRRAQ